MPKDDVYLIAGSKKIETVVIVTPINSAVVTLSSNNTNYGTVNYSSSSVEIGKSTTIIATPLNGSRFDGWYEEDNLLSTSKSFEFTVEKAMSIQAKFSPLRSIYVYTTAGLGNDGDAYTITNLNTFESFSSETVFGLIPSDSILVHKGYAGEQLSLSIYNIKYNSVSWAINSYTTVIDSDSLPTYLCFSNIFTFTMPDGDLYITVFLKN